MTQAKFSKVASPIHLPPGFLLHVGQQAALGGKALLGLDGGVVHSQGFFGQTQDFQKPRHLCLDIG